MKRSKTRYSNNRGSVLVLTCVGIVFIVMCLLIAYSFSGLYFVHNRLQTSADEIALTGAKKLNDRNRIGQMNSMIARCRQLVYASRDDSNSINKEFPEIQRFADQLLEESRQSALDLEAERKKMRAVAEDEAVQAMRAKFNSIKQTYAMTLPWMRVRTPRVIGIGLGCMEDTESSVEEFDQFEKLKLSDRSKGNTILYNKLNLYKANINQQLIEDDTDLPFFLSSLPPAIESEVSPARTILPDNYREADDEPIPTATKVTLDLQVENGVGLKTGGTMRAIGTAITTGASNQD